MRSMCRFLFMLSFCSLHMVDGKPGQVQLAAFASDGAISHLQVETELSSS